MESSKDGQVKFPRTRLVLEISSKNFLVPYMINHENRRLVTKRVLSQKRFLIMTAPATIMTKF